MARVTTAQIMEKVAGLLSELNAEGVRIAQYNMNAYTKNPKSLTAKEAKELYFDLIQNYTISDDEVEWEEEEDTVEMEILPSAVENSLKAKKTKEDQAVDQIVDIINNKGSKNNNSGKSNKLKPNNKNNNNKNTNGKVVPPYQPPQQEVVYDKAPSQDEIVELVGYRYSYPKFPLEFNCKALNGKRLINREDIKTLKDFKQLESQLYAQNGNDDNFVIAVYVKEEEIVDSRMYDYLNIYPNKSFQDMLKPYGVQHFPQELDILKIVHISDKVLVGVSMYTEIPYMFTHNRFKNNDKLHCRANFMGLDYQIYQVQH